MPPTAPPPAAKPGRKKATPSAPTPAVAEPIFSAPLKEGAVLAAAAPAAPERDGSYIQMSDIDFLVAWLRGPFMTVTDRKAADVLERQQRDLKEAVELLHEWSVEGHQPHTQTALFIARVKP